VRGAERESSHNLCVRLTETRPWAAPGIGRHAALELNQRIGGAVDLILAGGGGAFLLSSMSFSIVG
jgi:hypothetical protein